MSSVIYLTVIPSLPPNNGVKDSSLLTDDGGHARGGQGERAGRWRVGQGKVKKEWKGIPSNGVTAPPQGNFRFPLKFTGTKGGAIAILYSANISCYQCSNENTEGLLAPAGL